VVVNKSDFLRARLVRWDYPLPRGNIPELVQCVLDREETDDAADCNHYAKNAQVSEIFQRFTVVTEIREESKVKQQQWLVNDERLESIGIRTAGITRFASPQPAQSSRTLRAVSPQHQSFERVRESKKEDDENEPPPHVEAPCERENVENVRQGGTDEGCTVDDSAPSHRCPSGAARKYLSTTVCFSSGENPI
jgi:hypothetical protein